MVANMTCITFFVVLSFTIAFLNSTQSAAVRRDVNGSEFATDDPYVTREGAVEPSQPTMSIATENITTTLQAQTSGNAAEAEDVLYTGFGEFLVTHSSLNSLQDILRLDPALVYLTLNFLNLNFDSKTAYLYDTPLVIDPLTWTWASKGKGDFLRRLPPNFLYLSLGTLKSDVYKTSIDVMANDSADFLNADDTDKLQRLSEFLNKVFLHTYDANNQTQTEFKVCQEFFSADTNTATVRSLLLSIHVYMYLHSSFQVTCWSSVDNVPHTQTSDSVSFLAVLYYVAIILGALYIPVVISTVIIQHHQPCYKQDRKGEGFTRPVFHYDQASCPPVGLKHWLLFWGNHMHPWLYAFRIMVFIAIIFVGSYAEDIILRYNDDSYTIRLHSAYRSVVHSRVYIIMTIFLYLAFPCYTAWPVYNFIKSPDNTSLFLEDDDQRKKVFFLTLKNDSDVPEAPTSWPWCNKFHHYMSYRMRMFLDYRIIWSLASSDHGDNYHGVSDHGVSDHGDSDHDDSDHGVLDSDHGDSDHGDSDHGDSDHGDSDHGEKSGPMPCLWPLIYRVPIAFVLLVFVTLLYSPTVYILQWFCVPRDPKEHTKDNIRRWLIRVARFTLPVLVLFSILLWDMIRLLTGISSLFVNIFRYTFTGVLINYFALDPYFFMALSLTAYCFQSHNAFIKEYYQLKNAMIKVRKNTIKVNEIMLPKEQCGDVIISEGCFWYVVEKCKPLRVEVASRITEFVVISVLMYATFSILSQVELLVGDSDSSTLISAILVSLVLPIFKIRQDFNEDQYALNMLKARIKDAVNKYSEQDLTTSPKGTKFRARYRPSKDGPVTINMIKPRRLRMHESRSPLKSLT